MALLGYHLYIVKGTALIVKMAEALTRRLTCRRPSNVTRRRHHHLHTDHSTGWSAKFSGDAAESVRYAFGTDTIPTAFTAEAPAKQVEQEIRAMWPKCVVTVGGQ